MKVQIRLTRKLLEEMKQDLLRPHEFAAERVGFVFGKLGNRLAGEPVVLLSEYCPVSDENYIYDPNVGARINSAAIRGAMQHVLDSGNGAFHVHLHEQSGKPRFGLTDAREIPNVVAGLRVADSRQAHGMLLLSFDSCFANVWMPGNPKAVPASKISIVGYPSSIIQ
jgi:hypothetical protein